MGSHFEESMKENYKSERYIGHRPLGRVAWAGAVLLITVSCQAQNLFVSETSSNSIVEITPGGAKSVFATGLNGPVGLAFNSTGDLFAANYAVNGVITEITPSGAKSNPFGYINDAPGGPPYGLAFDSSGDLFISELSAAGVVEIKPYIMNRTVVQGLNDPEGMACDSAGDLFVADSYSDRIYKFTPGGVLTNIVSVHGPFGLAFNSAGDLYVSSIYGSIIKITPGGVQTTFASGLSEFCWLAIDNADHLFVADKGTGNIYEFTASGTRNTFASGLKDPAGLAFQPVPQLQSVSTGGTFQVSVKMPPPYYSTIVQASTNLVNWINIYTNTPPFIFSGSRTTTSARFYRAVLDP